MKRVLITGAGSYVGTHVMSRLQEEPDKFEVQELSVKGDSWKTFDFSKFDVVYHVAGIAHVSTDPSMESLYMHVNRDLTIEVAEHAKEAGVKQFIFMSSSIVYGDSVPAGTGSPITLKTKPNPSSFYGRSKLEAEEGLQALEDESFRVVIVRAPMIFGAHAKGNFPKLVTMAQKLPLFPKIDNKRSMIYIGNLAECIAELISAEAKGIFLPQEEHYICTSELVKLIAETSGKKIWLTKLFNPIIKGPLKNNNYVIKAFGDCYYDLSESHFSFDYQRYATQESIRLITQDENRNITENQKESNNNKVVWLISQESDMPSTGPHNRHYELAHSLISYGYSPIVFAASATRHSGKQMIDDNSLYEVENSGGFPFVFIKTPLCGSSMKKRLKAITLFHLRIKKVVKHFPDPIAILGSSAYPVTPLIGCKIAKKKHCKSLCEIRDLWPLSLEEYGIISKGGVITKVMYRLERYILEHSDEVIFTIPGGKQYIRDRKLDVLSDGKIDLQKVHYINNGVNLETFNANIKNNVYQNAEYCQCSSKKVVYTGSLRRVNNLDFLIDVFECLSNSSIELFLFGRGEYEGRLKSKCKELQLENVHFMGWVDKKYIPSILTNADLLVDFGISENALMKYGASHNKFFDYLASGKPIVSNHHMGFSLINEFQCGIEHAFNSPGDCAKAISKVLNSNEVRSLWGNNALKASEKFDFNSLAQRLVKIIES